MGNKVEQRKEWVEMIDLSPQLAEQLLSECRFEGQRNVRQVMVNYYAAEMAAGRFRHRSEMRVLHVGKQASLTNGQHRCLAVIKSGATIPVLLYHGSYANVEELVVDYETADGGIVRTKPDRLAPSGLLERSELSPQQFNALASAAVVIVGGFGSSAHGSGNGPVLQLKSPQVLRETVEHLLPAAQTFFGYIEGGDSDLVAACRRKSVLAVGLVTAHFVPDRAAPFWRGVVTNDGLRASDPRNRFVHFLLTESVRAIGSHKYAYMVAAYWNAFYRAQELKRAPSCGNLAAPIQIFGTPYDGINRIGFESISCEEGGD